ncbi:GLE1-like protein-domain-containing protein [Entophlyctis helioformis]|nr:GLE1-like protein-domain-containing protein [Entophlyctis helioformis]
MRYGLIDDEELPAESPLSSTQLQGPSSSHSQSHRQGRVHGRAATAKSPFNVPAAASGANTSGSRLISSGRSGRSTPSRTPTKTSQSHDQHATPLQTPQRTPFQPFDVQPFDAQTPSRTPASSATHHFSRTVRLLQSPDRGSVSRDQILAQIDSDATAAMPAKASQHLAVVEAISSRVQAQIQKQQIDPIVRSLEQMRLEFESKASLRKSELNVVIESLEQANARMRKSVDAKIKQLQEFERKQAEEAQRIADAARKREEEAQAEAKRQEEQRKQAEEKAAADAAANAAAKLKADAAKAKADEEKAAADLAKKQAQTARRAEEAAVAAAAWKEANPCLEAVMRIKTQVRPAVMANAATRNSVFKFKMLITQKTGQLTRSLKKVQALDRNLTEANKAGPQMFELVMDMTAKQIIKQASTEVAVKRNMAFPLANVCVLLFNKHKEFLPILLGRFIKKCPYIVPLYPRKLPDEPVLQFRKRQGYKIADGQLSETDVQYEERMCGILSLYAAIVQTDNIPNSYGIAHGWTWIARILNLKPRKITPLLIHTFLDVAGHALFTTYKSQAWKLAMYIANVSLPIMPPSANASTTRLKLYLEEQVKHRTIVRDAKFIDLEP